MAAPPHFFYGILTSKLSKNVWNKYTVHLS